MRAILDLAREGEIECDIIGQALREGQSRGLITRREISKAQAQTGLPEWLQHLLKSRA